jgi:L-asparaginase
VNAGSGDELPRVLCLTTGGTIASGYDAAAGGLVARADGAAVLSGVAGLEGVCLVELVELAAVSSTVLAPAQLLSWARELDERLEGPATGAVVVMGTEALEEAAYLFDLVIGTSKPVVFTGAMRDAGSGLADGPRNLAAACRVAVEPAARDLGVLVAFGEEVHAAREVVKTHVSSPAAFRSPRSGPVGVVTADDRVVMLARPLRRERIDAPAIETRVAYVKCVLGMDGAPIDAAVAAGARGLVIEGFPGGGVTPDMAAGVERALAAGVVVVLSPRAPRGELSDVYAGVGEGRWLRERGVVFARGLTGPKARIKLMLALGRGTGADAASVFDCD